MVTYPYYVAETNRHCTQVMRAFGESGICKTGAKGLVAAGVPELRLGISLKAQDGTKRAVEVALNFILHEIVLKPKDPNFRIEQPLYKYNDLHIGDVRPFV